MKAFINITLVASLAPLAAQAQIVTDNLKQELNADDIGALTDGSKWRSRTGTYAILNDIGAGGNITKVAATVNGGQTSSLFSNTLSTDSYRRAGSLGATTSPLTGTTLSVELWINTGFTGFPATSHTIFETGGSTRGLSITLGDNGSGVNNTLRFAMKDGSNSQFVDATLDAAAMAKFTNDDHHQLVVTYDNKNNLSTMAIYIDGALVGSSTETGEIDWDGTSSAGFWGQDGEGSGAESIGLDHDALTLQSARGEGSIAVFRHYSDVLTAEELRQNYTSTLPEPGTAEELRKNYKATIPEPGMTALLAGCFALTSIMVRRRR